MSEEKFLSVIDLIYVFCLLIGFVTINLIIIDKLVILNFLLYISIFVDWKSAKIANRRDSKRYLFLDFINVLNYISFQISLIFIKDINILNRVWIHWGGIFLIYIIWNIIMMISPESDKETKKFFIKYISFEIPLFIICIINIFIFKYNILSLLIIGITHLFLLIYWFIESYKKPKKPKKPKKAN